MSRMDFQDRRELSQWLDHAWTQAGRPPMRDLAAETGLAASTVHSVITGRSMPSAGTLEKVLDVLKPEQALRKRIEVAHFEGNKKASEGVAYLILKDGEVHDVVINDKPMALRQAEGEKAVLVSMPITHDFRERD